MALSYEKQRELQQADDRIEISRVSQESTERDRDHDNEIARGRLILDGIEADRTENNRRADNNRSDTEQILRDRRAANRTGNIGKGLKPPRPPRSLKNSQGKTSTVTGPDGTVWKATVVNGKLDWTK